MRASGPAHISWPNPWDVSDVKALFQARLAVERKKIICIVPARIAAPFDLVTDILE